MLSFETSIIYGNIERNIRHMMIRDFEKSIGAQSDKLHLPTMANYDGIEKGGRYFGGAMIKHIYVSVASFFFFFFISTQGTLLAKFDRRSLGHPIRIYMYMHVYRYIRF